MHKGIKCSLIISTYNRPDALEVSFLSVLKQTVLPNEIIIADDGSTSETKMMVESFKSLTKIPVIHIWHEDNGFQLSAIRNRAIAAASYEYIIQIDGDIILHPRFIEDHFRISEKGYFVTGSRVLLSEETTKDAIAAKRTQFGLLIPGSKNFFNGLTNKTISQFLASRYRAGEKSKYYVKGCNMAFWKSDLVRINGYDESFKGWGREDSEIAIRLMNSGIKKKFLKMAGIQYHLFHKEVSRENEAGNTEMLQHSIEQKKTWAEDGLDKYL